MIIIDKYFIYGLTKSEVARGDLLNFVDLSTKLFHKNIKEVPDLVAQGFKLVGVPLCAYSVADFESNYTLFKEKYKGQIENYYFYIFINENLKNAFMENCLQMPGKLLGYLNEDDLPKSLTLLLRLSYFTTK